MFPHVFDCEDVDSVVGCVGRPGHSDRRGALGRLPVLPLRRPLRTRRGRRYQVCCLNAGMGSSVADPGLFSHPDPYLNFLKEDFFC